MFFAGISFSIRCFVFDEWCTKMKNKDANGFFHMFSCFLQFFLVGYIIFKVFLFHVEFHVEILGVERFSG